MFDAFNKYRNKDGYIDLNKIPMSKSHEKVKRLDSYEVEGNIYLYKQTWNDFIREPINEEIAKQAGCKNAEYDLAIYNGEKGVLTKCFIKPNEEYISEEELLDKYSPTKKDNSLYSYLLALDKIGASKNNIEIIIREQLEYYIMDIFTIQLDRHECNMGFLKKNDIISLAPRFDNEDSFIFYYVDMESFLKSQNKKKLIKENDVEIGNYYNCYFRLLPGNHEIDSIIDYWKTLSILKKKDMIHKKMSIFLNVNEDDTYEMIRSKMETMDSYIAKASRVNFNEIYYNFNQYNIKLSDMLKNYYQELYETRVEMFFDEKSKVKTR